MTNIPPGQSIQAACSAGPTGETFMLADNGTYTGAVTPRAGQSIVANLGKATIIGRVNCLGVPGVTLRGFHVQGVAPGITEGAVMPGSDGKLFDLFIHDNETIGLGFRSVKNVTLERVKIYHNGTLGINSGQATTICENLTLTDCEVYDNNYGTQNPSWKNTAGKTTFQGGLWYRLPGDEGGGVKITRTSKIQFIRGKYRDNRGPGLWFDVQGNEALVDSVEAYGNRNVVPNQTWEAPGFASEIGEKVTFLNCFGHDNTGSDFAIWESKKVTLKDCVATRAIELRDIDTRQPWFCEDILMDGLRLYNNAKINYWPNLTPAVRAQRRIVEQNTRLLSLPVVWSSGGSTPIPPDPPPTTKPKVIVTVQALAALVSGSQCVVKQPPPVISGDTDKVDVEVRQD